MNMLPRRIALFFTILVLISSWVAADVEAAPTIEFVDPTPSDGANISTSSVEINVSITESNLGEMKFDWNEVNYTFYDDSLVLMMNFDNVSALGENDTHVADISRYGNNGTWGNSTTGNISYVTGKFGKAIEFDGVDDYVDCGANKSIKNNLNKSMSISVWIYLRGDTSTTVPATIVGSATSAILKGFYLDIWFSDIRMVLSNSTGNFAKAHTTNEITPNHWTHIVGTYNGSDVDIYKDGMLQSLDIDMKGSGNFESTSTLHTGIGAVNNGKLDLFNGTIDEVLIFNRSLSASEIQQLYFSNLYKYDLNKWSFYINEANLSLGSTTFFATASDSIGNENLTETRTIRLLAKTTDYYDNRKATVIFTGDDWCGNISYHNKFMNASDAAQKYKVVFSPGILPGGVFDYGWPGPNSSQWNDIQTQIDEGFVSPVSHSMSHRGSVSNYTQNGTSYEIEINGSKNAIINNLTLPWQNWFNGSEYLVGWIQPYGKEDDQVRATLAASNYLCDRDTDSGASSWADWDYSDGLYKEIDPTTKGDTYTLTDLNNNFTYVYDNNGIYHLYMI